MNTYIIKYCESAFFAVILSCFFFVSETWGGEAYSPNGEYVLTYDEPTDYLYYSTPEIDDDGSTTFAVKNKPGNFFSVGSDTSGGSYQEVYNCNPSNGRCIPTGPLKEWKKDSPFINVRTELKELVNNTVDFMFNVKEANQIDNLDSGGKPIALNFKIHQRAVCSPIVENMDMGKLKSNVEHRFYGRDKLSCNIPATNYQRIYEVVGENVNLDSFKMCDDLSQECFSTRLELTSYYSDVIYKLTPSSPGPFRATVKVTVVMF